MNKKNLWSLLTFMMVAMLSVSLTACSSDDDEDGNGGTGGDVAGLVSAATPSLGWSGDMQNGIVTYCPEIVDNSDAEDEYDMDYQTYYAFAFENGACKNAVFDMICPSEAMAKQLETAFKNGTWADMDEDDDDEYDARAFASVRRAGRQIKSMTRAGSDYNLQDLSLPVLRSGKVLYIYVECLKEKSGDDVKSLVLYWEGKSTVIPNKIISGKWDEQTGRYVNNNLLALGITYEINTTYENNLLKSYVTTMTFPNTTWAQAMYDEIESQNKQIASQTGLYPEATLSGRTLKEKAVIYGDVTKEQTLQMITVIDWAMSRPFFVAFSR